MRSGVVGQGDFPYRTNGGIVTSYVDGGNTYVVHTFLESGKFFVHSAVTIDYLIVGGGGGGGGDMGSGTNGNAAGGGAGGLLTATSYAVAVGEHAITVGLGGHNSKGAYNQNNGGTSSIGSLFTAFGGGHGGSYPGTTHVPGSGDGTVGSAGGQGQGGNTAAGWTGTPAQGNFGSPYTSGSYGGGGGGGAGGVGHECTGTNQSTGGYGGSALGNTFRTGATQYYAGGGAGATHDGYTLAGLGGNTMDFYAKGGGGDGKWGQQPPVGLLQGAVWASDGLPNTGGGGGGGEGGGTGAANGQRSGNGGSGIVVIRYTI
jgi:hypothetical protein